MSYSDFLSTLQYGIDLFVNGIKSVASSLISNYIFITILGLVLFSTLVLWLFDLILDKLYSKRDELDYYLDRKKAYALNQDIAMDYYYNNKLKIYALKFDKYRLSQLCRYNYLKMYKVDEFNYNYSKLVLNKAVASHFITYHKDMEYGLLYQHMDLDTDLKYNFQKENLDRVLRNRIQNIQINSLAVAKISKDKKNNKEKLPKWFNKKNDIKPISDTERKEIEDIIQNF